MISCFLFLHYLLSNTILLGTEASEEGKKEGKYNEGEYISQPSFLPAVDFPLWDVFIPAKCTLSLLSTRKPWARVHICREENASQQSGTKLLSPKHLFIQNQQVPLPCQTLPLEVPRACTVWGTTLACISEEQNSWGMRTTSITLASGRH